MDQRYSRGMLGALSRETRCEPLTSKEGMGEQVEREIRLAAANGSPVHHVGGRVQRDRGALLCQRSRKLTGRAGPTAGGA